MLLLVTDRTVAIVHSVAVLGTAREILLLKTDLQLNTPLCYLHHRSHTVGLLEVGAVVLDVIYHSGARR